MKEIYQTFLLLFYFIVANIGQAPLTFHTTKNQFLEASIEDDS